jgi:glycosyltransferase involved in cell wall biosynthesis
VKILFASADWSVNGPKDEFNRPWPGGAGWYRCRIPALGLAAHGHVVRHVGAIASSHSGEIVAIEFGDHKQCEDGFEVVVMQRWMLGKAVEVIERAKAMGQVVIQDVDDWYWGLDPSNRAWESSHPNTHPTENREHYRQALGHCSALTVSTPYLAERLNRMFPDKPIYVVRNAIDLYRWEVQPVSDTDRPVIGWVGAVGWRSGDLEILKGILGPFVEQYDLAVIHAGVMQGTQGAFAKLTGVDPRRVTERSMASIHLYPLLWRGIDVALAPLSDQPFNEAKSSVKAMEAAASGIPVVTSAMSSYKEFGVGRQCKNPSQWLSALTALLKPEFRQFQAREGLIRVQDEDIEKRWKDWERIYWDVLGRRSPPSPVPEISLTARKET